ncbi:MAG: CoA-binding protein [Rhodobacteraceae bacterium]|nr:CoA-binding protein [Paracoccaceae bacterium]
MQNPSDAEIRTILASARVIAVVGISANPDRPSHGVARFLQARGYRVVPVNPGLAGQELLGEHVWADLASVPAVLGVDMVDIFRRSDAVPEVVAEALAHQPALRTVWMQLGVENEAAAAAARARGVAVVQNRCPAIEWPRLMAG